MAPQLGPAENKVSRNNNFNIGALVYISIRPTSEAVSALSRILRASIMTYPFEPLVYSLLADKNKYEICISYNESGDRDFYIVENRFVFLTCSGAQDFLIKKEWDAVFDQEESVTEPPVGKFSTVMRCGITGALLGPPNYHEYDRILREHYTLYLKSLCSWDIFKQNLKSENSPQVLEEWMTQVTHNKRYYLKDNRLVCFLSYQAARYYLTSTLIKKTSIVSSKKVVLKEGNFDDIKDKILREAVLEKMEKIKKNPSEFANSVRTALHHLGLHVYRKKKSGQPVTVYISSIKRHVRDEYTHFTEPIECLIQCIEDNPYQTVEVIAKAYCLKLKVTPSEERSFKIRKDLIWLIEQGYITQYEDGSLYVSPRQTYMTTHNIKKSEMSASKS